MGNAVWRGKLQGQEHRQKRVKERDGWVREIAGKEIKQGENTREGWEIGRRETTGRKQQRWRQSKEPERRESNPAGWSGRVKLKEGLIQSSEV